MGHRQIDVDIPGIWDASDWKNSKIMRPEKEPEVPEFKPGDRVVIIDEKVKTHGNEGAVFFVKPDGDRKIHVCFGNFPGGKYSPSQLRHVTAKAPIDKTIWDPTTLPDWCKLGGWVYEEANGVGYIVELVKFGPIRKPKVAFQGGCDIREISSLKPVEIRPWTKENGPLILKLKYKGEFATAFLSGHNTLGWGYVVDQGGFSSHVTMEDIAKNGVQLDGSPCGVPETIKSEKF